MPSETEIANFALAHLKQGLTIASLSENSAEARACDAFFDAARDEILREFDWPFATKIDTADLTSDADEAYNSEWYYSYRYPSDCLKLRRILSGNRNETRQSAIAFRIIRDDDGLLILTDQEDAEIEYTMQNDTMAQWPIDACMALSYRLAMYIAPRIITEGGSAGQMAEIMSQMYRMSVNKARGTAGNEETPDEQPESEFTRGR